MPTKFQDFMREIEREARAEGPAAREELAFYRERFRLARRFLEARKKKGLTQATLAKKAGLDQSEISNLESGNTNPTLRTVQRVASVLGCRLDLISR